jgi:hypothetical protein
MDACSAAAAELSTTIFRINQLFLGSRRLAPGRDRTAFIPPRPGMPALYMNNGSGNVPVMCLSAKRRS